MHDIGDYTTIFPGWDGDPVLADKTVLYVGYFTESPAFFKFTATAGKVYVVGVESEETQPEIKIDSLGLNLWRPSSDPTSDPPDYNSESDSGPELYPFDYELLGGARIQFTAQESGDYVISIYPKGYPK